MKSIDKILFVIQARLNSKRTPGKMLRPFAGTTLMDIAIQKIMSSSLIPTENFYLSVYEPELVDLAKRYGVNLYHRSEKSQNAENSLKDLYEWHDRLPFEYAIKINACNPFLSLSTIEKFTQAYMDTDSRGLFAVMEKKTYFWMNGKMFPKVKRGDVMNTKIAEPVYEAAHCLYAGRMDLIKEGIWMGDFTENDPELFAIPEQEALDIDHEWQFQMCEALYDLNFNLDDSSQGSTVFGSP
jgi:CMP-N-acetylneuraminic acid synthetase